jgi:PAS domain S-box-containing protein
LPILNHPTGIGLFWLSAVVVQRQQNAADHLIHMAALEAEHKAHPMKEHSIRRQADEIHDLYNRAPCGYHSLDITGRFIEVNDTELQWLGYTREEIVGQMRFADLVTPHGTQRFHENFTHFVAQESTLDLELDLTRKDRSILPISLSATAIRDERGRYRSSRATIVDITKRRRTEEALHRAHEALELLVRDRTAQLAVANRHLEAHLQDSRKAERALQASEGRFRLMTDHAPVLIWTSDTTRASTWFNKALARFCRPAHGSGDWRRLGEECPSR